MDYDDTLDLCVGKLKFDLIEDSYQLEQLALVGNQIGGRVFLFLSTDDFWRDYHRMLELGSHFVRPPQEQDYGTVAVFEDLYGNLWDLLQFNDGHPMAMRAALTREG
ncbi:VOC family protein [Ferrimonas sp. SCSIO 43195]|uniref:VOC family protein n=1 Tax=Ferrimonas sp. SCSIO 43195 TaxID=2822844 RepID=UPI0035314CDB